MYCFYCLQVSTKDNVIFRFLRRHVEHDTLIYLFWDEPYPSAWFFFNSSYNFFHYTNLLHVSSTFSVLEMITLPVSHNRWLLHWPRMKQDITVINACIFHLILQYEYSIINALITLYSDIKTLKWHIQTVNIVICCSFLVKATINLPLLLDDTLKFIRIDVTQMRT